MGFGRKPGNLAKSQYAAMAAGVCLMVVFWIGYPMMTKSSLDSSVNANLYKPKAVDLKSVGLDVQVDGSAPGMPLTGEMSYNPATSTDTAESALYQPPEGENQQAAANQNNPANVAGGISQHGGPGGAPSGAGNVPSGGSSGTARPKLSSVPSITGAGGGSSAGGGSNNQFFGTGNVKADIEKPNGLTGVGFGKSDGGKAMAALQAAKDASEKAAAAKNLVAAKAGSNTAFDRSRTGPQDVNGALENAAADAGGGLVKMDNQVMTALKKNDGSLSKSSVKLPTPKEEEAKLDNSQSQLQQMLLQMLIQSLLGPIFQGMGKMLSAGLGF